MDSAESQRRAFGDAHSKDRAAAIDGARWAPELLEHPASAWRRHMRQAPHYRSFGTLRYLLEVARAKFETEPTVAVEITAAVLDFVDEVSGPSHIHEVALRALARKEHANALRAKGDLRKSLRFAKKSIAIYESVSSLGLDAAKAKLVAAQVLYDMGEYDGAESLVIECGDTFEEFNESTYRILALLTEGVIHYGRKQFRVALSTFRKAVEQAEKEGNKDMLVRGLHNLAQAAHELGDIEAARDLYPRVIQYMVELNLITELPRVTWGYALTLVAEGKLSEAISELYKVRNLYQHLGMNLDAATAELEIVRISFQLGKDITAACSRLVESFVAAGASQNALEAFAYLREQSASGMLTLSKIERVRTFAAEVQKKPNLRFLRPSGDA
jgi:tetratricopeptide (TPR) repeat protein